MVTDHELEGRIHGQQQEVQVKLAAFFIHDVRKTPGAHVIRDVRR